MQGRAIHRGQIMRFTMARSRQGHCLIKIKNIYSIDNHVRRHLCSLIQSFPMVVEFFMSDPTSCNARNFITCNCYESIFCPLFYRASRWKVAKIFVFGTDLVFKNSVNWIVVLHILLCCFVHIEQFYFMWCMIILNVFFFFFYKGMLFFYM